MRTDKRIKSIADATGKIIDLFESNVIVADIATDHGYIAEKVAEHPKVCEVIATDISEKCLDKTKKLVSSRKLQKITTMLGDGLKPIIRVDVAVISGIGGYEIINMLSTQNVANDGSMKCRYFVLQPAQNEYELRKWIFDNKIYMFADYVIEDAERFYPIITIDMKKRQRNKKNIFNLRLGRDNDINNQEFKNYLLMLKENLAFIDKLDKRRIKKDKVVFEKFKLNLLIEKLLNK